MELFAFIICLAGIGTVLSSGFETLAMDASDTEETAALVAAFRQGDQTAFNRLVLLHQTRIYNLALNYVKSPEEAKDLTQDIFVTAYRSLPSLREDAKFSSWLYQIALNHCRNRYKKLQRSGFFSSYSIDDPDSGFEPLSTDEPASALEQQDRQRIVREAIGAMPVAEKEIIMLRDIQGLSYEEIATALDLPLGTVKSKLNRARHALKDRLKHLFDRI